MARLDGRAVGMGGWRRYGSAHTMADTMADTMAGDIAEIKRVFVVPDVRGASASLSQC